MAWLIIAVAALSVGALLFVNLVFVHESARTRVFVLLRPLYKRLNPIICLVDGAGADRCRNILAAGHCTLKVDGSELSLTAPRIISLSAAEPQLCQTGSAFGAPSVSSTACHCKIVPRARARADAHA